MGDRTEKQKMFAGDLYDAGEEQLVIERKRARRLCREYNATTEEEAGRRAEILTQLLGTCPANTFIEPNFRCDYGYNIHVGEHFTANFDLIILDVCEVRIGRGCLIGPRVGIYTASHPLDRETRASGAELGKPVTIGDDVWIGGNAVINPGVEIGDNVIIASGAVVTKSFGSNLLIGGVPARVIRTLES